MVNTAAGRVRVTSMVLIALAAFIVFEGLWAYRRPLHRDISIYAVLGHELLRGRPLYSDLLELRPPAVIVTYAVAEAIAGYGRHTFFLLYVTASILTLLGIYYAASTGGGGATAGLWAAAFWAALSGTYRLDAGEPNTEVFMNACSAWAFGLWLRLGKEGSGRLRIALIVGALFALGSLYKHVVVICPLLLALAHVLFPPPGDQGRRRALVDVAVVAAVGVVVWALVSVYFTVTGRLEIFREVLVGRSLEYAAAGYASSAAEHPSVAGVIVRNILAPLHRQVLFLPKLLIPLGALAGLGVASRLLKSTRRRAFLLAFAAAAWIEIALPGQFYGHYHQLWFPPLAVGSGWAIAAMEEAAGERRKWSWLAQAAGAATLSFLIASQIPLYRMNAAGDWSPIEYDEFLTAEPLAREIDSLLAPGETFYEWGDNPMLYIHSGRTPPSGVLSIWWFLGGRHSAQLSERVVNELERAQPELLVVMKSTWLENPSRHPVSKWLVERYRPLPGNNERGPFAIYARRGGCLEARLAGDRDGKWLALPC